MADNPNIRSTLRVPGPFSTFNREERSAVATLYAALLLEGNLQRFADVLGWTGLDDPAHAEIFVEWTYLRDLWDAPQNRDERARRAAILAMLDPSDRAWLETCTVEEFNVFFGAVPRPSATYIQSPGKWSLMRYAKNIADHDELRRTCIFKWAFNVKPDLVVQSGDQVLCVEAKWGSGEGVYPSNAREIEEFKRRGLDVVRQTTVQQYLVDELLGYRGEFRYLARRDTGMTNFPVVTWAQVFDVLDIGQLPAFVRRWAESFAGEDGNGEVIEPGDTVIELVTDEDGTLGPVMYVEPPAES